MPVYCFLPSVGVLQVLQLDVGCEPKAATKAFRKVGFCILYFVFCSFVVL
jgi:hypothetical protein